jgi:hypothetical protein
MKRKKKKFQKNLELCARMAKTLIEVNPIDLWIFGSNVFVFFCEKKKKNFV